MSSVNPHEYDMSEQTRRGRLSRHSSRYRRVSRDTVAVEALETGEPPAMTVEELEQKIREMEAEKRRMTLAHEMALIDAEIRGRNQGEKDAAEKYKQILEQHRQQEEKWRDEARLAEEKALEEKKKRIEAEEKYQKLVTKAEEFAGFLKKNHRSKNGATDESTTVVEEGPVVKRMRKEAEATRESAESPPTDPKVVNCGVTAPPSFAAAYSGLPADQKNSAIRNAALVLKSQTDQLFGPAAPMLPSSSVQVVAPRASLLEVEEQQDDDQKNMEAEVDAPMDQMARMDPMAQQQVLPNPVPFSYSEGVKVMMARLNGDADAMRIYTDPMFGKRTCLWDRFKAQNTAQVVRKVPTACNLFQTWYSQNYPGTSKKDIGGIWEVSAKHEGIWKFNRDLLVNEQNIQKCLQIIVVREDGRHRQN